jgi:hypothetical protein
MPVLVVENDESVGETDLFPFIHIDVARYYQHQHDDDVGERDGGDDNDDCPTTDDTSSQLM